MTLETNWISTDVSQGEGSPNTSEVDIPETVCRVMDLLGVDPDLQKSDGFAQEVHTVIKHAQKGMDRSIKKNQDSEQDAIDDLPQVQKLADILAINIYSEENYQKGIRAVLMIRRSVLYKMEVTKIS